MTVSVAEYLGQRTDVEHPEIKPVLPGVIPSCPFMSGDCAKSSKITSQKPNGDKPICSVRKTDGSLWIVCQHRLCATRTKYPLSTYQIEMLMKVAREIFGDETDSADIAVKREVGVPRTDSKPYRADYVMINTSSKKSHLGQPTHVLLEMQGGGETNSTGKITSHVQTWEQQGGNGYLRNPIIGPGSIETNAWRRQQEQFLVKGNTSVLTGGAIAFCVGTPIYDYLSKALDFESFTNLKGAAWTLALIGIKEEPLKPKTSGSIPLVVDKNRVLYTNYHQFVEALLRQGSPQPGMFEGEFDILNGGKVIL